LERQRLQWCPKKRKRADPRESFPAGELQKGEKKSRRRGKATVPSAGIIGRKKDVYYFVFRQEKKKKHPLRAPVQEKKKKKRTQAIPVREGEKGGESSQTPCSCSWRGQKKAMGFLRTGSLGTGPLEKPFRRRRWEKERHPAMDLCTERGESTIPPYLHRRGGGFFFCLTKDNVPVR